MRHELFWKKKKRSFRQNVFSPHSPGAFPFSWQPFNDSLLAMLEN